MPNVLQTRTVQTDGIRRMIVVESRVVQMDNPGPNDIITKEAVRDWQAIGVPAPAPAHDDDKEA